MANTILIFTDEFMSRVEMGLGEIAAKLAIPVIVDIDNQKKLKDDPEKYVALIEQHLQPYKDEIVKKQAEAKAAAEAMAAAAAALLPPPETVTA
jgi:hypothetical protein